MGVTGQIWANWSLMQPYLKWMSSRAAGNAGLASVLEPFVNALAGRGSDLAATRRASAVSAYAHGRADGRQG